jgi:(E)-4-hydroxy-3-methylbut-2-enyl-diphosphate synthase
VPLTVSVLGCVVNGIGEGKEADIGIAGGEGHGILFKEGKLIRKVKSEDLMETLLAEIEIMAKEREAGGSGEEGNGHGKGSGAQGDVAASGPVRKEIPILKP